MNMADSSDAYCFHISLKDFKHEPDYLSTIYTVNCVLHTSFAVLTIFGKTTVLVSIWKTPSLHAVNCSFGVSRFIRLGCRCTCTACLPSIQNSRAVSGFSILCELRVLFNISGFFLSLFSCFVVTAISVEKYLAIYLHLRYQQIVTVRRVLTSTLGSFLIAAAATVLVVWYEIMFLITGVLILACLALILFANIRVLSNLGRHHRQIHDLELSMKSSQRRNTEPSAGTTAQYHSVARYRKSVFTISYVVAAMLICYLPYLCSILARSVVEYPNNSVRLALNITHVITFANSAWNPFLFCWRIREIRRAVVETLLCKETNSSFQ